MHMAKFHAIVWIFQYFKSLATYMLASLPNKAQLSYGICEG